MEAIEAIMTRRSVRIFEKRQIPDSILDEIILAGTYAPSGLDLQPWGFVVVQDQALLNSVSDYCKPRIVSYLKNIHEGMSDEFRTLMERKESSIFHHAPTIIIITGKTESQFRGIDCFLCAENMMLAANALGIGSCWIGSVEIAYDNEELMAGFRIPESYSPVGTIAFGYPAEKPEAHDKKKPHVTWVR
jgi:nitroreductase